mgnify:CR=1 FL=1
MAAWFGYVLICYLAADLLSGFWHWWEDRYASESWPIIGRYIAKPNQLHHDQPLAFLNQSYWNRNYTTILPAAVHAWAHSKGRVTWLIAVLQDVGLFQSPRHHAVHHIHPFAKKYCVMTDWLNPILDELQVWRLLEWMVYTVTRIEPHGGIGAHA